MAQKDWPWRKVALAIAVLDIVSVLIWLFIPFDVEFDARIPKLLVCYRRPNIHWVCHKLGLPPL